MWYFQPLDASAQLQAGAGDQTLTPTRFVNASTFGAHTIAPGAVTLTATIYTDPDTFGAHVISQGGATQTLNAALYADPDTFGSHTVTATYTLTAALYGEPDTFGSHTITQGGGTQTLTATLYADPDTFGSHAITPGAVALTATLFQNQITFGAHVITGGDTVSRPRGDDAFGSSGQRERFWRERAEEAVEELLDRAVEAARQPRKARARVAEAFDLVEWESLPEARKTADVLAALNAPQADYTHIAALVLAVRQEIEAERTKRRRKRDLEAVLMLGA